MKPLEKINLGIIGAGAVTVERHIPSVKSLNDPNVSLMAVADIKPGLAESVAKQNGIPYYFTDYKKLLAMDEINTVSVCTPTPTHKEIAIDALKAGKNVYLEKPATVNEAEMQEVLKAAKESGKVFVAGSNGLLQRQMPVLKRMIDCKELGEVFSISITRIAARNSGDKTRKTIGKDSTVYENASHGVEWVLWFLNDPKPIAVTAIGHYKYDNLSIPASEREPGEVVDNMQAIIQFDNGSSFFYKTMRSAVTSAIYEMNIYGDKGSIKYDVNKCYKEKSDDCIIIRKQDDNGLITEIKPIMECGRDHSDMYRHFIGCIREGKQSPISNGERCVVVMRILDAINASIKSNGKQIILK